MQAIMVVHIQRQGEPELAQIVHAGNALSRFLCLGQSRQKHRCQDGHNRKDDQHGNDAAGSAPAGGGDQSHYQADQDNYECDARAGFMQ